MAGKWNRSGSGPADADGELEAEAEAREVRQTAHAGLAGAEGWGAAGAPAREVVGVWGVSARGDGVDEVEDGGVVVGFAGGVAVEERHF